jgi:hypothetical protein
MYEAIGFSTLSLQTEQIIGTAALRHCSICNWVLQHLQSTIASIKPLHTRQTACMCLQVQKNTESAVRELANFAAELEERLEEKISAVEDKVNNREALEQERSAQEAGPPPATVEALEALQTQTRDLQVCDGFSVYHFVRCVLNWL